MLLALRGWMRTTGGLLGWFGSYVTWISFYS
jgi:hypothetical protein